MIHLEGPVLGQLRRLAIEAAPREAVGLILSDGTVVSLPNHSENPTCSFEVRKSDLATQLGVERHLEEVVLWHSHPSGGVGPSRTDMAQKTPLKYHLVISLVDGDIVPSWY